MAITATKITASRITANPITATQISAGGGGAVCRNVSNFNGVDSYVEFDNSIILGSSFNIESFIKFEDLTSQAIYDSNANAFFRFENSGARFGFRDDAGNAYDINGVAIDISSIRKINIVYTDSTDLFEIYIDDVIWGSRTVTGWTTFTIDALCRRNPTSDYLNGSVRDLSIIDSSVQVVDLPMDETSETSTINYINRTGNTDYNATGYNITVTEECEGDASAWVDTEGWVDGEPWID